ncbi:MAG: hypothetical protein ACK40G_02315 [Cytophagaceae bacterium]
MNRLLNILFSVLLISSSISCNSEKQYSAESISSNIKDTVLAQIIPYLAKLPKGANYTNRFEDRFQPYFKGEIKEYQFISYHVSPKNNYHYFMVKRPAPSMHKKYVAIAGRFIMKENLQVEKYEEIFWTFKMKEEELTRKSSQLFELMVQAKDLSRYYPRNSDEDWIEFPDDKVWYDKSKKRWVTK